MVSGWIGLSDLAKEGSFEWLGGGIFRKGYTNWRPGEPNGGTRENCVEFIPGMKYGISWKKKWNDKVCKQKNHSLLGQS